MRGDVSLDRPEDRYHLGHDLGSNDGVRPDRQRMGRQLDPSLYATIDRQVLRTRQGAVNKDGSPKGCDPKFFGVDGPMFRHARNGERTGLADLTGFRFFTVPHRAPRHSSRHGEPECLERLGNYLAIVMRPGVRRFRRPKCRDPQTGATWQGARDTPRSTPPSAPPPTPPPAPCTPTRLLTIALMAKALSK